MDKSFFDSFRIGDYQRDNFDRFLKHVRFNYDIPSIHITGTNGKGSTACYLASAYIECGYKVGLFKSPFLFNPNEMISINNVDISDEDFLNIYNQYKKEIDKYHLSAFEIQTFVGLTYFKNNKCDIAIIECGMGGEVDATNIFIPILSIITTISLEHTDYLGYSISEIAMQKAGIIKEKVPVLVGNLPDDAMTVIYSVAKDNKSEICYLGHYVNDKYSEDGYSFEYADYGTVKLQSLAKYSIYDAVMSLEALSILSDRFPISKEKAVVGIGKTKMPCRLEILNENPLVVVDGAHNPEGMALLCKDALPQIVRDRPVHVIFACFRDKNLAGMLASVGEITDDLTLTTFDNPRARTEDEYFLFAQDYPFEADAVALLKRKIEEFPEDIILVTGSLAFAAYMSAAFKKEK